MSDAIALLERLDERTETLVKRVNDHVEEDRATFKEIFKDVRQIDRKIIYIHTMAVSVVVVCNLAIGAWVKGLF